MNWWFLRLDRQPELTDRLAGWPEDTEGAQWHESRRTIPVLEISDGMATHDQASVCPFWQVSFRRIVSSCSLPVSRSVAGKIQPPRAAR